MSTSNQEPISKPRVIVTETRHRLRGDKHIGRGGMFVIYIIFVKLLASPELNKAKR